MLQCMLLIYATHKLAVYLETGEYCEYNLCHRVRSLFLFAAVFTGVGPMLYTVLCSAQNCPRKLEGGDC
jgi:hypothetical protein